jgi:hypothetical protein
VRVEYDEIRKKLAMNGEEKRWYFISPICEGQELEEGATSLLDLAEAAVKPLTVADAPCCGPDLFRLGAECHRQGAELVIKRNGEFKFEALLEVQADEQAQGECQSTAAIDTVLRSPRIHQVQRGREGAGAVCVEGGGEGASDFCPAASNSCDWPPVGPISRSAWTSFPRMCSSELMPVGNHLIDLRDGMCNPLVVLNKHRIMSTLMTHKYRESQQSLREVKPNLLIRHKGSQRIFISLNR